MVFGTLVGVFVFSVMWSELLMTSAISCPLWSSVYELLRVECVPISVEDCVWYVCDVLYAVLYVRVSCFVVRRCAVSRRYIDVCNCDVFSVVNVYHDHLKFRVVCINGRRYVCCSECYVVSNEPTPCQMDGEAGWWTTSGKIGLPPQATVMGVGRQQHPTP